MKTIYPLQYLRKTLTDKAIRSALFKLRNNLIKSKNNEYRTGLR